MTTGLTVFGPMVQRSSEWLEARRGMVTASIVGKLITPTLGSLTTTRLALSSLPSRLSECRGGSMRLR